MADTTPHAPARADQDVAAVSDMHAADPAPNVDNLYRHNPELPTTTEPYERVDDEKDLNVENQYDAEYRKDVEELKSANESKKPVPKNAESKPPLDRSISTATSATTMSTDLESADSKQPGFARRKWYSWLLLKSRTIPPIPREREVSHEYRASWFSKYTFQWINPLMVNGYQRPLELNDIWLVNPDRSVEKLAPAVQASFDKRLARGEKRALLWALHEVFFREFWWGGLFSLSSQLLQVITPFVLRYLIQFSADAYQAQVLNIPGPHIGDGIGLVIGITVMQIAQSAATSHYIYRGFLVGGQMRMTLISLIFDKSMRISARARAGGKSVEANDAMEKPPPGLHPGTEEERKWFKKMLHRSSTQTVAKNLDTAGYSNGRIITLMSVDTSRIDLAMGMFHMTWTSPVSIIVTLVLLLINITYSALAGFGFVLLMMPLLAKSIKSLFKRRGAINKITDQRVSLTQEILSAVRFVKYFGWETSFLDRLHQLRKREIRAVQWLMAVRNAINAVSMSVPIFAAMLAFITYALTGHELSASRIFSSLALFNALRLPLNLLPQVIGQVTDAAASVGRIEQFLSAEEAAEQAEIDDSAPDAVRLDRASFTWEQIQQKTETGNGEGGGKSGAQQKGTKGQAQKSGADTRPAVADEKYGTSARLAVVDEKAGLGDEEPASPSSLDSASTLAAEENKPFELREMSLSVKRNELIAVIGSVGSGKSSLLSALAGDMRQTSGHVRLGASRAFCPQSAWIQNAAVKDNILFGKDMRKQWYNAVVDACALRPDFDMFPNGELTEIGERGITVSGGQKQRLNIARAIYHDSEMVIMDDPLSAVDAHVGRHIMDHAICGLLRDKCRILATHQLWVLSRCDRIVWLQDGQIIADDTYEHLMANSADFKQLIANNAQEEDKEKKEKKPDDEDEIEDEKKQPKKKKGGKKPGAALMQAEEKAVEGVSSQIYSAYLKASGGLWVAPLVFILLLLTQGANIMTNLWLSYWTANKYPGLSMGDYVGIYAGLGALQALLMFVFSVSISIFGSEASKVMLHRAMTRVLRAPMSFFDTTPLGRITNRFSKDVDVMDTNLAESIRFFAITMGMIVSVFALVIAFYYYFAVALVPLLIIFMFSAAFYQSSGRELKRHEAVLRSHVYARFSEAVTGIATIRAYRLQERFSKSVREAIDNQASAYFLTFANQRWLSMRIDAVGIMLVFVVGILVVTSRFSVNPSTGGLVLSYILSIVQMLQFTIRQFAEVQNNMNSTERIHYYGTQLGEEPPLRDQAVPPEWPQSGAIDFDNVEMRYRDGLPLVLKGLHLSVRGGERIGVVGRTGAGKSSIMSTLFRLVEISSGRILIDGVDISRVGLMDLRQRLSIIPQDPTLFRGTVRSNLDPFGKYDDLQLWNALRQAGVVDEQRVLDDRSNVPGRIHLDSSVEEEGANFSLGQRQLMALARALVRGSRIIVCDEATSSVDMETDAKIQRTIAHGFKGKTLLCIAHRLRTILDYDRIVVMDQGSIAECDTPLALYEQGGIFRGMCDRSNIRREDFSKKTL